VPRDGDVEPYLGLGLTSGAIRCQSLGEVSGAAGTTKSQCLREMILV
jgi:hypothetical protein